MNKQFSSSGDYIEFAECLQEFYIHKPGIQKFYVPALMSAFIGGGEPLDISTPASNSHLLNKNKGAIPSGNVNTCNYIEIRLPEWITAPVRDMDIFSKPPHIIAPPFGGPCSPGEVQDRRERFYFYDVDDREYVSKGKKFIIGFIGGDYTKPWVIGRYD